MGVLSAKFLVGSLMVIDTVGFFVFFVLLEQLLKFLLIFMSFPPGQYASIRSIS